MKDIIKFISSILPIVFLAIFLTTCGGGGGTSGAAGTSPTDCSGVSSSLTCVAVTSCGSYSSSNTYYLLMSDISASGNCLTIGGSNTVFDLNQHTANYATGGSGVGITISSGSNLEIKNGNVVGGKNSNSHAIVQSGTANDLKIHHLNITAGGVGTQGMDLGSGTNLQVYNNTLKLDAQKADPCSHYSGHLYAIGLAYRGGKIEIYNNNITGNGMFGIYFTGCGSYSSPALIHDNYVSMWSPTRDGYAIAVQGNNTCDDGHKIYSNTIDQVNGRGIIIGGWNVESDNGVGNVEVYQNKITVREGWDCEYNSAGTGVGIRVRFGAHDNYVHDNQIYGLAGTGVAKGSAPDKDGSTVTGLYVGAGAPYGSNNRYESNYVEVSSNNESFDAIAVYGSDSEPSSIGLPMSFKNNTFKSNNLPIRIGGSDGGAYNVSFSGDKIIKGDNPINFKSVTLGWWILGATGINLLDVTGQNGADVHDIKFDYSDSGAPFDAKIAWTLTVTVRDSSGNNVSGASVQINDSKGSVAASGVTNAQGIFAAQLTEETFVGTDVPTQTTYTPHTVTASYSGGSASQSITMDSTKSITLTLGSSGT